MKQNKETLKQFFETGDKPTQEQYSDLIDSYIDVKQPEGEANRRFVIDEAGEVSVASEQQVPEYTLSPISGTNTVDLLKDGVSVSQIDLTPYLDNTNLARLVSGTVDANGLATFTRDDNSTFTVDLSNLKDTVPQYQAGTNITIDNTNPLQPIINASGGGATDVSNLVPYTGATQDVDLGDNTLYSGKEITKTNYNIYQRYLSDSTSLNPVFIKQTQYWNGSTYLPGTSSFGIGEFALFQNTGSASNAFGNGALQNNTGPNSTGFGNSVLQNNTGTASSGFGHHSLLNNSGGNSSGFGNGSLQNNTGSNSSGFGNYALGQNTANSSNGFGSYALYQNTGTSSNGFGNGALQDNSGGNSNGVGNYALKNNTADSCVAFGNSAMCNNTGINSIGLGHQALYDNTGAYSNGVGYQVMKNNTGAFSSGIGGKALYNNIGVHVNALGYSNGEYNLGSYFNTIGGFAGQWNTGDKSVGIGGSTLRYNDFDFNTAIGYDSFNNYIPDGTRTKIFLGSDVDLVNDTITITAHGFGSIGDKINLMHSDSNILGGLTNVLGMSNQFEIIDANTIKSLKNITSADGGTTYGLTPQLIITNTTTIGANSQPDKSNQIVLGDLSIEEVTTAGDYVSTGVGKGLILKTPDGTKQYRISIDDSGNIITTLI